METKIKQKESIPSKTITPISREKSMRPKINKPSKGSINQLATVCTILGNLYSYEFEKSENIISRDTIIAYPCKI